MSIRATLCAGLVGCLVLGLAMPVQARQAKGKRYALLVGVRTHDDAKLSDLKYTENDVEELAKLLVASGYDVTILTTTRGTKDKQTAPTTANIRKKLKDLLEKTKKEDTVLIAFAGNGLQMEVDNKGKKTTESVLCPSDARFKDGQDIADARKGLILVSDLFKELDECGAGTKLMLLDAARTRLGGDRRSLEDDSLPRPGKGLAVLYSCKAGERAFETDKLGKGHGVFFFHVIEGLKGKAKSDEGDVTWNGLTRYVRQNVTRVVPTLIGGGARQTPHLLANVEGDPILVAVKK